MNSRALGRFFIRRYIDWILRIGKQHKHGALCVSNRSITTSFAASIIWLACGMAHAQDNPHADTGDTRAVMDLGIARGGDKIVGASFYIGGDSSIHAGDAYYADFGLLHRFENSHWSFKATLGYSFAIIPRDGGNFSFRRTPLDVIAIYNTGRQHFGIGLTDHMNPRFDADGHDPDVHYNNAAGALLQYQYRMFGVRYTYIRYKAWDVPGNPVLDGSSLGLFVSFMF